MLHKYQCQTHKLNSFAFDYQSVALLMKEVLVFELSFSLPDHSSYVHVERGKKLQVLHVFDISCFSCL